MTLYSSTFSRLTQSDGRASRCNVLDRRSLFSDTGRSNVVRTTFVRTNDRRLYAPPSVQSAKWRSRRPLNRSVFVPHS